MTTQQSLHGLIALLLFLLPLTQVIAQDAATHSRLLQAGAELNADHPLHDAYLSFQFEAPGLELNGASIGEKADQFWQLYGQAWGIDRLNQLQLVSSNRDPHGRAHLVFQQMERGIPVLGAELSLHFTADQQLIAGGGFFVLPQVLSSLPTLAEPNAIPAFSVPSLLPYLKDFPTEGVWQLEQIQPQYLAPYLLDPKAAKVEYAVYKIHLIDSEGLQEVELLLNAADYKPLYVLPLHCDALNRELYNNAVNSEHLAWVEGDDFPGFLSTDQQELLRHTEQTYSLFFRTFGRDSYDDEGGTMEIVYDANILTTCPNARAGTTSTFYCTDAIADDVTAHEWTHVYIRSTSALIYSFESGAINESLADIFGEVVDLINGTGNDAGISNLRNSCIESNTRWKIGEDGSGFGTHLRDMAFPNCRNDPDDRDDAFYECGTADNGGVHSNSGLLNRSFALLVDGGTHNGLMVNGIGLTKAAHIYAQAMFYYNTSVTDFFAMGDQLKMAANDLLDVDLTSLTTVNTVAGSSGEIISAADLLELDLVIQAVELQVATECSTDPLLAADAPELCGSPASLIFAEDWEAGLGNWTIAQEPVDTSTWISRDWELCTLLPDGRPGQGVFGITPLIGDCDSTLQHGSIRIISPVIHIPDDAAEIKMSFAHYLSIEQGWDGGIVFIRRNNGNWNALGPSDFTFNGYNRSLQTFIVLNDNPYQGFWAFSGADENSNTGSWGTSNVDLSAAGVNQNDSIQLAWYATTDGCNGWLGWYLDEIEVSYCSVILPVELTEFQARPQGPVIAINWATAVETDNSGFWLERSINGRDFRQLAWIDARAETGSGANYDYIDRALSANQLYYYRLRQQDIDGLSSYSAIVSAQIGTAANSTLVISPNPATASIHLSWSDQVTEKRVELISLQGRVLKRWTTVRDGQELQLPALAAGVYLLRSGAEVQRLIIH